MGPIRKVNRLESGDYTMQDVNDSLQRVFPDNDATQVGNLCDKCGSPKAAATMQVLGPRIGRKRPQVNNQSFTQSAMDRSEILQAAFVGNSNLNGHNTSHNSGSMAGTQQTGTNGQLYNTTTHHHHHHHHHHHRENSLLTGGQNDSFHQSPNHVLVDANNSFSPDHYQIQLSASGNRLNQ